MTGKLEQILLVDTAGARLEAKPAAQIDAGKGIVGDRYYAGSGTFSKKLAGLPDFEVTLIEAEEIVAFNAAARKTYDAIDFRRNLLTSGIRLNDLEGEEFTVGEVRLKGIRLCEPCAFLAGLLGQEVVQLMVHKAGLRAQVLVGGNISIGDSIQAAWLSE